MNIITLSFIIISACCAVSLHDECSITSANWDGDGEELIKEDIQYCLIDSCLIRRMDTGEELNVTDIRNDTLITMARDDDTATVIALLPNEEYCQEVNDDPDHVQTVETTVLMALKAVLLVLVIMLSAYVIIVCFLWDNLQSSVGELFFTHMSIFSVERLMLIILIVFHTTIKTIAPICKMIIYIDLYLRLSNTISFSVLFVHIAYLLYQCRYQHFEISASWKKNLLKFYTLATFTAMIPMICFVILLDGFSGMGENTVSSDGHCIRPPVVSYPTFIHLYGYSIPWKVVQVITSILIIVHYRNLSSLVGNAGDAPSVKGEPKVTLLFGLASLMMISTLCSNTLCVIIVTGLSSYVVSLYFDLMVTLIDLIQQSIIAMKLTMLLKIKGLPKRFLV